MKKLLFVFNPNSGKAQIKNKLIDIINVFTNAGYEVNVYPTKAPMDGYQYIVENGSRYDLLVCSGGDGTLNETVGAVLKIDGEKPAIGYIPSGTTNDFASSLGIPKDMIEAANDIVNGLPVKCDIGVVNGKRNFNYVAAFGAFTEVSYATPQYLKNTLGHPAYVLEAVKSLMDLKPCYVRIRSTVKCVEGSFTYGMISNANTIGGLKGIAGKGVDLNDGLFEVLLVKEINNPLDLQKLANAFITKDFANCDMVYSFKTDHIEFECAVGVNWTLDGEFGGSHKILKFDVIKDAVQFVVNRK